MSEQSTATTPIAPDARPRLPHGVRLVHSEAQGGWVLLAPERVFKGHRDVARPGGQEAPEFVTLDL